MRYSKRMSFEERLALVRRGPDDCWLWPWARTGAGYGHFRRNKRDEYAHRAAYEMLIGPIPEGHELDHTCRHKECCNPAHTDPVLHAAHVRRTNSRRLFCRNGHRRSEHGWHTFPNGTRLCQACYQIQHTTKRMIQRGEPIPPKHQLLEASQRRETHCAHGHERAVAGWKVFPNGFRICQECDKQRNARRQERRLDKRTATRLSEPSEEAT